PVRAALPARRGGRADHRSLRPPRDRAHLPDRQGGVRAPARLRQRARMAQPRRDVRHPPGGRSRARLRDAHPACAAPEPGAAAPPILLGAISLDLFVVTLGGVTALLPIYARDILETGPWGLGLLRSGPAIGALLMSIWLAHFPIERRAGLLMFASTGMFGLAI